MKESWAPGSVEKSSEKSRGHNQYNISGHYENMPIQIYWEFYHRKS